MYGGELTGAQNLMESMASPGLHYEVKSADDLIFFFEDIANQIGGRQYVYIRIACPVDVTVTSGGETLSSKVDSENTRTSFGALTYENTEQLSEDSDNEIDFSQFYYDDESDETAREDQVKVLRLDREKDYDIKIDGYADGTMDYTVKYQNAQENTQIPENFRRYRSQLPCRQHPVPVLRIPLIWKWMKMVTEKQIKPTEQNQIRGWKK